jgi:hypothetical protein
MTKKAMVEKAVQKSIQKIDNSYAFSPILQAKLQDITDGIIPAYLNMLYSMSEVNASTIADYILTMKTETNLSNNYKQDTIMALYRLSKYCHNPKPYIIDKKKNLESHEGYLHVKECEKNIMKEFKNIVENKDGNLTPLLEDILSVVNKYSSED